MPECYYFLFLKFYCTVKFLKNKLWIKLFFFKYLTDRQIPNNADGSGYKFVDIKKETQNYFIYYNSIYLYFITEINNSIHKSCFIKS